MRKKSTKQNLVKNIAIGGAGVLLAWAGWKYIIKPKFFPDTKTNEDETSTDETKQITSTSTGQTKPKSETSGVDIDKKVKPGDKGELVYRIQKAINAIANLRGDKSIYDKETNKTVNFPLPTDKKLSEFASRTVAGAKYAFPAYKSKGYITVRRAREQWARVAGYYDKSFPADLVGASNYDDLQKIYDYSKAKKVIEEIF